MPALSPMKAHHLSLTWRVIALSSLLLLTLVTLLIWLGHHQLTQQFDNRRVSHHERQQREIHLAMQRSAYNLRQLASLTSAAPALSAAMAANDWQGVAQALETQWPSLQLEAGVDDIYVFNIQHDLVGHVGISEPSSPLPLEDWIREVVDSETPLTTLRCQIDCRQFATVPMLMEGDSIGAVVLSTSLADVMRESKEVSGSEITLLATGTPEDSNVTQARELDAWNAHLVALTNEKQTLPLVQQAAALTPLFKLVEAPFSLQHGNRYAELSAVYMEEDADWRSTSYFLLISDVTEQVQAISHATQWLLWIGILGWLAAELLLLAILLGPMARLRRVASLLPALASGEFSYVRTKLTNTQPRLANEIDTLEHTTRELSFQLEMLENTVTERSNQLADRVHELAGERDFISSLLDTARVFIVVQNRDSTIQLVNGYTRERLGLPDEYIAGRHFSEVFDLNSPTQAHRNAAALDEQPPFVCEEEKTFQGANRRYFTVMWYHAELSERQHDGAARVSVGIDITERKAAEARLSWLAQHDPLTELFNRRYLQTALQEALSRQKEGAILLLDIDQFKTVNELSGHDVGDRLLRQVAERLFLNLGQRSTIARLGGDEFALLLESASGEHAINVAEYITQLLDSIGFSHAGRKHHISASIGIALFPDQGRSPAELLANADIAMYRAKENSSCSWYLLCPGENAKGELKERLYWIERLHNAFEKDDFELMVQPIVRLADGDIKHYEVLVRMRNPDGSLIQPMHFIPIAEQSGLIITMDRWVLRHSLAALRHLQARNISLAVNISGQSLHDQGLHQYLIDEFKRSGADPRYLILEITETAAITDFSSARNVLQAFRELGCRTALDDFGIGFSSFHYLGQLPVDYIKIDGSFIRSLMITSDSHTIVKAVADIAKGFGKQTIAEFVDQEALLPILSSYGIDYTQGFYLGEPETLSSL